MRNYKLLLQNYIRDYILEFRAQNEMTQEDTAKLLRIASRSYFDQEHGKYSFSSLSLMFFLNALEDDEMIRFVRAFKAAVEREEKLARNEHPLVYYELDEHDSD